MSLWKDVSDLKANVSQLEDQMKQVLSLLASIQSAIIPPVAVMVKIKLEDLKGNALMQMSDIQSGNYAIQNVVDAKGQPAVLDPAAAAAAVWSIDDASVASLAPAADGMSCAVSPLKVGQAKVSLSIPAAGAEPAIVASDDLIVVPSAAVSASIVGTVS